jgi:hypothetical protein
MTASSVVLFGFVATTTHAADPAAKCAAGKIRESAKYASCRLKAEAKGVLSGTLPDFARCDATFDAKFSAIEGKVGIDVCPTFGDSLRIGGQVVSFAQENARALSGFRYEDCGDGTVADISSGLMWQKTDELPGLTGKYARYTWAVDYLTEPSGTVFTEFIGGLNGQAGGSCYAGHCDWRLPTRVELETILLGAYPCQVSPCIDQSVFGPVDYREEWNLGYWTATTVRDSSATAWVIWFGSLESSVALASSKRVAWLARAVRVGSCS